MPGTGLGVGRRQLGRIIRREQAGLSREAKLAGLVGRADVRHEGVAIVGRQENGVGLFSRVDVLHELADGTVVAESMHRDAAPAVVRGEQKAPGPGRWSGGPGCRAPCPRC